MALIRRTNNPYGEAPIQPQPDLGTVSPTPTADRYTIGNYTSTPGVNTPFLGWSNPALGGDVPDRYFPTSASDPALNLERQFGMLGSFYAPNIRMALDTPAGSGWGPRETVGGGGVSVAIDYDLPNKQATFGTPEYFRKIYRDMTPISPEMARDTFDAIQARGYFKGETNPYKYVGRSVSVSKTHSQSVFDMTPQRNLKKSDVYATPRSDWREAPSLGRGYTVAPISISGGRGVYSSPTYSMSALTNINRGKWY